MIIKVFLQRFSWLFPQFKFNKKFNKKLKSLKSYLKSLSHHKSLLYNQQIYIQVILFVMQYFQYFYYTPINQESGQGNDYVNHNPTSDVTSDITSDVTSAQYNPGLDKNNPENMIQYTHNNKYYVSSYNEDDPNNPYRRSEQIYKIKSLVDHIQGIKRYRDISKGWIWDDRHKEFIVARTHESEDLDRYLQDIWDNVDTYTTKKQLITLKDLEKLWSYL